MTINSLNLNQSAVIAGLGTTTFNVLASGFYDLSFKTFIPSLSTAGPAVTTQPSVAVTNITCVADVSTSLNDTYFIFYAPGNLVGWYVWYSVDGMGSNPSLPGLIDIQIQISSDDTADDVAAATRALIASDITLQGVAVSGATDHVILTNISPGTCTATADGAVPTGFAFSDTAGSYGVPAISGLSIVINSANDGVLARYGYPSASQSIMGSSLRIESLAGDVITFVLSSLSSADLALNAVKTILNLDQGE